MATIQKVKNKNGISYKVFIRNKGLKSIIKTFSKKQLATQFIHQIESDAQARVNSSNCTKKSHYSNLVLLSNFSFCSSITYWSIINHNIKIEYRYV